MPEEVTPMFDSTLLVGHSKSGKTHSIVSKLAAERPDAAVLWLAFDNKKAAKILADLPEAEALGWNVTIITDWDQFETIKTRVVSGLDNYDVIVLDGLAALARMKADALAPNGMSVQQWGIMSREVHRAVRAIRDCADLFATVLVRDVEYTDPNAKQGQRPQVVVEYDLNQDLKRRLVSEFDDVMYTSFSDTRAGRSYDISDSAFAAFQPVLG